MQTLTHISLFIRFKNNYCKVYFVVRSSLENGTFSKYQALMAYCAGQKLSDFHMIKYVVYKLQTAAHVAYKRDKNFFSQDQFWVGLSFSYNKCSNPKNEALLQLIKVLHWEVKENGFFAVHQALRTVTIDRVALLFFWVKRVLRHPRRLGLWVGFKSGREVGRQDGLPKVSSVTRSSWSCC